MDNARPFLRGFLMTTRRELANCIRALSMDAVQQANSGHPGAPMGMADIAEVLWRDFLKHNPANPRWHDRDRFILSNGHASMLLYALLHLTGYPLSHGRDQEFPPARQPHRGPPGARSGARHRDHHRPARPGPRQRRGLALAEKMLAAQFNRPGFAVVDHYTWVFCGDGCLMEGISHEACSLAGTLKLGKLIVFYDDNGISIDGKVQGWFADDTPKRFEAYGWHVQSVDGHDDEAIAAAIRAARAETERPSLIYCKTIIGWGAPTGGHHGGARRGAGSGGGGRRPQEARLDRPAVRGAGRAARGLEPSRRRRGRGAAGRSCSARYASAHPELAREFERRMRGELPADWTRDRKQALAAGHAQQAPQATRQSSQATLNVIGAANAGAVRRLGRPDRLQQHPAQGPRAIHAEGCERQLSALRRARIRHDRGHERHRAARRLHPLRRHLSDLLRLRAQCGAHGGADAPRVSCSSTPTTRSGWARTAPRTSRSST